MMVKVGILLSLVTLAWAANDTECAVNVPGFTHNGDCNLLCRPASWTDIITFFLGNYVAHAATVITQPGQSTLVTILSIIGALLFPGAGITRGVQTIHSLVVFAPTELQRASKAGALCMVVKWPEDEENDSQTADKEVGRDIEKQKAKPQQEGLAQARPPELEPKEEPLPFLATNLHGICRLPKGYDLLVLPRDAKFENDQEDAPLSLGKKIKHNITSLITPNADRRISISCSYSVAKILIAVGQLLFAVATLYRTRGNQVSMFGYAAFGLTVAQYAWMSFINLLGNLTCPQYPSMFLVGSKTLDNLKAEVIAQHKQAEFPLDGAVGRISAETEDKILGDLRKGSNQVERIYAVQSLSSSIASVSSIMGFPVTMISVIIIVGAVPIAIIGGLSRFSTGSSALYQRVWTMLWLVFGLLVGPSVTETVDMMESRPVLGGVSRIGRIGLFVIILAVFGFGLYAVPAIGGFVVVGQMITQYGVCIEI